jgi:outer membrane murein-binding lipoprotein Lpp
MRLRACLRRLHTAALAKQPQARAPQPHCSCAALALTPRRTRVRSSAAAVRRAVGVCWPARRGRRSRADVNGMHRNAARAHLLLLLTRAVHLRRVQSIADASGLVTAEVAVGVAFFSAVAFLNGITQKSVDSLKADVNSLKADVNSLKTDVDSLKTDVKAELDSNQRRTDRSLTLMSVVSLLTLLTVLYMAVAAPARPS